MMRSAPRTPKAGSIFVSRLIECADVVASGVPEVVAEALTDTVGVTTRVTLKTVGIAVVTATF
jgi:hypothetical protein